jgi:hypothetical protein
MENVRSARLGLFGRKIRNWPMDGRLRRGCQSAESTLLPLQLVSELFFSVGWSSIFSSGLRKQANEIKRRQEMSKSNWQQQQFGPKENQLIANLSTGLRWKSEHST